MDNALILDSETALQLLCFGVMVASLRCHLMLFVSFPSS